MSLTITATNKADLLAQVADLTGATSGTGTGGGTTTPPPDQTGDNSPDPNNWSAAKVTDVYFPTDPALAKFPSPDGSRCICDADGPIHGRPYLVSAGGVAYQFLRGADGKGVIVPLAAGDTRPPGHKLMCGGTPALGGGAYDAIIAQGVVYFHAAPGGQACRTSAVDSPGSGTTVTNVPPTWSNPFFGSTPQQNTGGSSGGNTGGVPLPPLPPAQTVAFGSTGKTILFGPDQALKTIASAVAGAAPGDTVKAAPSAYGQVFAESFDIPEAVLLDLGGRWTDILAAGAALLAGNIVKLRTLWSVGAELDGTSLSPNAYSHGLGGAVFLGNGKIVGAHIQGFGNQSATHDSTAAIRAKGNCVGQIQGDHLFLENNQNGIANGTLGQTISGPWSNTIILDCGLAIDDGGAHNVYDSGGIAKSICGPGFYSSVKPFPKGGGGHAYKTRAPRVEFIAPVGLYSGDSTSLDIPNGTGVVVQVPSGVRLVKKSGDINHDVLSYGTEQGAPNGLAGVEVMAGAIFDAPQGVNGVITSGPVTFDTGVTYPQAKPVSNPGLPGKLTVN